MAGYKETSISMYVRNTIDKKTSHTYTEVLTHIEGQWRMKLGWSTWSVWMKRRPALSVFIFTGGSEVGGAWGLQKDRNEETRRKGRKTLKEEDISDSDIPPRSKTEYLSGLTNCFSFFYIFKDIRTCRRKSVSLDSFCCGLMIAFRWIFCIIQKNWTFFRDVGR